MPRRTTDALPTATAVLIVCMAWEAPPALAQAPAIDIQSRAEQWLLAGSPEDPYWVIDNRWGQGSIPNGAFSQGVGGGSSADGRVAFRMQWQWPQGDTEVKGYPAALYGRKPGYAGYTTSLLQGAGLAPKNDSATGALFPLKLPVTPVKAHVAFQHNSPPSGQGHLTFDIWLQSDARQDNGWTASSITHEIMIPLDLWGNYGAHNTPGGRNPGWYDHDATIAGKLYHVYITKDGDGCSRYNFGSLSGAYGKTGWKLIAFVPAELPVAAGELDIAAIVNHVATRKDACGEPWARGDEYLVSAELGVEPVVGGGDISVYDYKLSNTGVTATGTTVVVPARPLGGGGGGGGGGSNAGPGGGGGGHPGNGGGGNTGNAGNGGNGGNAGNGGNDGGANGGGGNAGGGNTGGANGGKDDDAKKGKDKYHKYEKDGGRFDKNGNKARPVTVNPRSESTEGTAPPPAAPTPPAAPAIPPAPTPPATGATLPPPPGATVPPPAGSVLPPAAGATLPPPAGATLPPPAGATLPPAPGATLQPAAGGTPASASVAAPPPATSATAPAPAPASAPPTPQPTAAAAPVPAAPAPAGAATVPLAPAPAPPTSTTEAPATDEPPAASPTAAPASPPPATS